MSKEVPSRSLMQVHRFGDRVAASLQDGPTQYMSAGGAELFAEALLGAARSVRTEAFTDSTCGTKHISPSAETEPMPAPKAMPAGLAYLNDLPWIVRGEAEHENAPGAVWGLDPAMPGDYRPWPYFIRADVPLEPGMIPLWIASEIQDLALAEAIVAEHNAALERRRAPVPVTITPAQVAILRRLCEAGTRIVEDVEIGEINTMTEQGDETMDAFDSPLDAGYALLAALEGTADADDLEILAQLEREASDEPEPDRMGSREGDPILP